MGTVGFGVVILLLVVGAVLGVRRVVQGRRRWDSNYPDQPTIPVLFQPQDGAGPSKVGLRGDRPLRPSPPRGFDGSEMIGRRHGAPPEEARRAPATEPKTEGVAAAASRPREAGAERAESGREARRVGAAEAETPLPRQGQPSADPVPFSPSRPLPSSLEEGGSSEDEDHTLQLLPGRMEVVAGGLRGREIRFIRTQGDTYTFGRQAATDASHIQLDNATVSREHAAMRFVNGRWRIRNLSRTNPLRINGVMTDTPRKEYTLHDGDRIELGEVAFLFREQ